MRTFKKILSILIVLIFATFSVAQAQPVNHALASDPVATMKAIDAMGLTDLSDKDASQVRGSGFLRDQITKYLVGFFPKQYIDGFFQKMSLGATNADLQKAYPGLYGKLLSYLPWYLDPIFRPNITN